MTASNWVATIAAAEWRPLISRLEIAKKFSPATMIKPTYARTTDT
jgi:hypothetical protein